MSEGFSKDDLDVLRKTWGSATLGGPLSEDQASQRAVGHVGAAPQGGPTWTDMAVTGAGLAAGSVGGWILPTATRAFGASSPFVEKGAELLGRVLGNVGGSLATSDVLAPPSETPEEASQRQLEVGAGAVGGELAAPLISKAGQALVSGARTLIRGAPAVTQVGDTEMIRPGAEVAQALIRSHGATLAPAQMGRMTEMLHHIAEGSFGGFGIMEKAQQRAEQAAMLGIQDATEKFTDNLGRDELGTALKAAIQGSAESQRAITSAAYSAVDAKVAAAGAGSVVDLSTPAAQIQNDFSTLFRADPNNPVVTTIRRLLRMDEPSSASTVRTSIRTIERPGKPTTTITTQLQRARNEQAGVTQIGSQGAARTVTGGKLTSLSNVAGNETTTVPTPGQTVTFQEADKIRSLLFQYGSADSDAIPGLRALANAAAEKVGQAMDTAGLRLGPLGQDVMQAYGVARATSRVSKDVFNNDLIARLMNKAAPEEIVRTIGQAQNPTRIEAVRRVLFDPAYRQAIVSKGFAPEDLWREVQGNWLSGTRAAAGEGEFNALNGSALVKQLEKSGGTFEAMFPNPVDRAAIKTSARALELAQSKAGGIGTGVFVKLVQARAVYGSLSTGTQYMFGVGDPEGQAGPGDVAAWGTVLVAPAVVAKVLSNPRFASFMLSKALARGMTSGIKARAMGQMMSQLVKMGVPFVYQHPNGETIPYDPSGGPTGAAPSNKPVSKFRTPAQ